MNDLTTITDYKGFKTALDTELNQTAESFVRIGYLLKQARDTNILAESGYKSVVDFAQAEYNIDKTQVSRFIHINDKFSEGGYSDHLLPQYQGFGYSKLTLMLALPDAVNEALTPDYSKSEINEIKQEVEKEKAITPLEVMMEPKTEMPQGTNLENFIYELGKENPRLFCEALCSILTVDAMKRAMAPDGEKMYFARIRGVGRQMLSLSDNQCQLINSRTGEAEVISWEDIRKAWERMYTLQNDDEETDGIDKEKMYSDIYGIPFPKDWAVPVQQSKVEKAKNVEKTISEAASDHKNDENVENAPKNDANKALKPAEILDADGNPVDMSENEGKNAVETAERLNGEADKKADDAAGDYGPISEEENTNSDDSATGQQAEETKSPEDIRSEIAENAEKIIKRAEFIRNIWRVDPQETIIRDTIEAISDIDVFVAKIMDLEAAYNHATE